MTLQLKRVLVAIVIVMLGIYAAWSVSETWTLADRLRDDRSDLAELKQKLAEIEQVSAAPRVAALEVEPADAILNRILRALRVAGLKPDVLANHTPSQPQRMGQSDFTLRRVEIKLKPASVPQIVAFCEALRDEATGSVIRDLQLFDPQRSGPRETWNSQMTLTQVVYSPKSDV